MLAKLDMTEPKNFRGSSAIPRVLVLHFADLPRSDIGIVYGVNATKPLRTTLDLLEGGHVPLPTLPQSLSEGLRQGLIRRSEIVEATKPFTADKQLRTFFSEGSRLVQSKSYATALTDQASTLKCSLQSCRRPQSVSFGSLPCF